MSIELKFDGTALACKKKTLFIQCVECCIQFFSLFFYQDGKNANFWPYPNVRFICFKFKLRIYLLFVINKLRCISVFAVE